MKDSENLFSIILASTVHDMKNSLGMMSKTLETILASLPEEKRSESNKEYGVLQYEYSRVNNLLMQLLAIYKIDNNQLSFTPGYHNVYDFIEEQILNYLPLFEAKGFSYQIDIDDELEAAFDESLMSMAISNVIGNTIRYAHSKILINANANKSLTINICDDGPGYPGPMLEIADDYRQGINPTTGSTGLGLFFAQKIAQLHTHAGDEGYIKLSNGGSLGGGIFEVTIP